MNLMSVIAQRNRAAGFNPASLAPELWLDTSDGGTMFDASTGGSVVSSGGYVGRIADKSAFARNYIQAASGSRPQFLTGDGLQFDGTSQHLGYAAPALSAPTYVDRVTLPDGGLGAETGKGWTNTGLFWDSSENAFWVANDGRANSSDSTYDPSIIKLNQARTTILAQIDIKAIWSNNTTVQGVAVDTTNNSLWFCALQENKVRNLTKTGVSLGELSITGPNGLAYDAAEDRLIVLDSGGTIRVVNKSSGAFIRSYACGVSDPDQLYFDQSSRLLYLTYGANRVAGNIRIFYHDIGTAAGTLGPFSEVLSTEGIAIVGNTLYFCNDGWFHDTTPFKNEILSYTIQQPLPIASLVPQLMICVVGKARTPGSPTRGWWTLGRALTEAGTVGLYPISGDATMRPFLSAEFDDISVSGGAGMTSDAVVVLSINATTQQGSLTVNGGTPSTFGISTPSGYFPAFTERAFLGCGELSGTSPLTADRYSAGRTKEYFIAPTASETNRQKMEGYLAHKWSLQSLLPSGHPYKSSPP
jgi:hypothetical protein